MVSPLAAFCIHGPRVGVIVGDGGAGVTVAIFMVGITAFLVLVGGSVFVGGGGEPAVGTSVGPLTTTSTVGVGVAVFGTGDAPMTWVATKNPIPPMTASAMTMTTKPWSGIEGSAPSYRSVSPSSQSALTGPPSGLVRSLRRGTDRVMPLIGMPFSAAPQVSQRVASSGCCARQIGHCCTGAFETFMHTRAPRRRGRHYNSHRRECPMVGVISTEKGTDVAANLCPTNKTGRRLYEASGACNAISRRNVLRLLPGRLRKQTKLRQNSKPIRNAPV